MPVVSASITQAEWDAVEQAYYTKPKALAPCSVSLISPLMTSSLSCRCMSIWSLRIPGSSTWTRRREPLAPPRRQSQAGP